MHASSAIFLPYSLFLSRRIDAVDGLDRRLLQTKILLEKGIWYTTAMLLGSGAAYFRGIYTANPAENYFGSLTSGKISVPMDLLLTVEFVSRYLV
jgi:hypothetical protein